MTESLESLLERLHQGDADAAERIFSMYEPYLRLFVRRRLPNHLRAKFDSVDIVQSIWLDVWSGVQEGEWRFQDAEHLRAFLIRLTRNRFLNRVRQHERALKHEQALARMPLHARGESPIEASEAAETWDRLVEICPATYRKILLLRRDGVSLEDIARQMGMHAGSVRRILYGLQQRLKAGEDEEN